MAAVPFDTMATARFLRESGIEERRAAAIKDGVTSGVTTKSDLAKLEVEIKAELRWIKLIGGAILVVLILPWLAELVSTSMPG